MWYLLGLFGTHLVADFMLQSREMGKKKSEDPWMLIKHCAIQFFCFLWAGWLFSLINAVVHGLIDWNIWRFYKSWATDRAIDEGYTKENYPYWEDHQFYLTIGVDQFLHTATIVVVYFLLNGGF